MTEQISCTVSEAVVMTGIGRTRIYDLISRGAIEARYEGRKILVSVASLRRYYESLPTERAG